MSTKTKFRLAFALVPLAAAGLVAATYATPAPTFSKAPAVDDSDWGHVRAYDGAYMFMLGPSIDQRRKYELGLGRVSFTSAGVIVADDDHLKNALVLDGKPMGRCGYHWQGPGVNVLVAIGRCVPGWADVTGSPGTHARLWIRAECLRPTPCVVVVKYQ